jgi:thiamine-monophosphate kinase
MGQSGEAALTVRELGERGTLARILPLLPVSNSTVVPPGDDSAVSTIEGGAVVTTCDMMIEGPDFRLDWSTPHDVGWKAMASNLADVAAMGATPTGVIVALACPPETPIDLLEGIARGVSDGLKEMAQGCGVLGGDLSTAPQLCLSVTVLGELAGRAAVLRSGARPGDVVAVAGELGVSERGLRILRDYTDKAGGVLPQSTRDELRRSHPEVAHHLAPTAPIALGVVAAQAGATAMMDISDGLVLDATRLAEASGVNIDLDFSLADNEEALMGGEDHGLLVCFPRDSELPHGFRAVGNVVDQGDLSVSVAGAPPRVSRGGWDPYRDASSVNTAVSP